MIPLPHQKIIIGKEPATLPSCRAAPCPARLSPARKMYPLPRETAAASDSMRRAGSNCCSEVPPGLQKGSMENRIEQKNAKQQRSEFSEFQKHGQLSHRHPEPSPKPIPVQGDTH